ncbi:MAG: Ppx/GppA family phosphatase [Deltaproteobacteria bacterium]|nr:Ppx/GppA family phosphatase [Deltaproteobacteria bacterium]
MKRVATIDIGTNTVLLLVAQLQDDKLVTLAEQAEITRLGKDVDKTGRLNSEAIKRTAEVLAQYVKIANSFKVDKIFTVATSAARDAQNSEEFFALIKQSASLTPEIISGDEEARLVWAITWRDFGNTQQYNSAVINSTLSVLDVGGGSSEFIFGSSNLPTARTSLQIGSVRLAERVSSSDPMTLADLERLNSIAFENVKELANMPGIIDIDKSRLIAVAGTATTLAAVAYKLERYDASKVHGSRLSLHALEELQSYLASLTVEQRACLPGMEPKRADVIVAGCAIITTVMNMLGYKELVISDRGVRWGLLYDRIQML